MPYLVIAYPEINAAGLAQIQAYREKYDVQYNVIMPHFTMVFATGNHTKDVFIAEVHKQLTSISAIDFTLRSVIVNKDAFSDQYHLFLMPDEGFSHILKLHGRLHGGLFATELRHDITYIPHITLGNTTDAFTCSKWADEWNEKDFTISGTISKLSVIAYEEGLIQLLDEIALI